MPVHGGFTAGVPCRAGPGKALEAEAAMLRSSFGLVQVPGVGEASRGGCQGPLGRGGGAVPQEKPFLVPK